MNINATNIVDFISCPARFYYRAVRRVKVDLVESDELIFGREMHDILEKYPIQWKTIEDAIGYIHKFNDTDKFLIQVDTFLKNFSPMLSSDDESEVPFTLETEYYDVYITGRFDRILKNGTIIDWKTGNVKNDLEFNVQAILYNLAYKTIYGKEPKNVLFCSLKTGKSVALFPNQKLEDILIKEIIPAIVSTTNYIHSGLFNGGCNYCIYKNICYQELGLNEKDDKENFKTIFAN